MRVSKLMPRVWFDSVEDAIQCGALGIRISSDADQAEYDETIAKLEADAGEAAETSSDDPEAEPEGTVG
jgi:hypothetical protein